MSSLMQRFDSGDFLVLVSPPKNDPALVAAAFAAGVDGAKCHLNVDHRASGRHFGSWTEEAGRVREMVAAAAGPMGVMPGAGTLPTRREFGEMQAAGLDFFDIYASDMPAWMWELPMTRMIAVGHGQGPEDAVALESQGMHVLEASVVDPAGYGQPLTAADLEGYRALCDAVSVPVMVPSQRGLVPTDLARLAECGVAAVLLGTLSIGDSAASFAEKLPGFVAARDALGT